MLAFAPAILQECRDVGHCLIGSADFPGDCGDSGVFRHLHRSRHSPSRLIGVHPSHEYGCRGNLVGGAVGVYSGRERGRVGKCRRRISDSDVVELCVCLFQVEVGASVAVEICLYVDLIVAEGLVFADHSEEQG